jgi:hypothetical protein
MGLFDFAIKPGQRFNKEEIRNENEYRFKQRNRLNI